MSIASRITSMENNIRNAYHGLDSIGIDTTNTNKNIENISALLDDFYDTLPKVSGTGINISLSPTRKGRITSQINGDTLQDGTPTPDTLVEIQSGTGLQKIGICGKNWFNPNVETKSAYPINNSSAIGNTLKYNSSTATTSYVNCMYVEAGVTYTLSWEQSTQASTNIRVSSIVDGNNILLEYFNSWFSNGNPVTFTPNNSGYLILAMDKNAENIQIEKGSTATTYEAYSGETYPINLGTIELFNGDTITGTPNNWNIARTNIKSILNGTQGAWTKGVLSNETYTVFAANFLTKIFNKSDGLISDKLTYNDNLNVNVLDKESIYLGVMPNAPIRISILNSRLSELTSNGLNNYLSNNNVDVVGKLQTPTTEPITDTTLINDLNNFYYAMSKNGETNISVDGNLPIILDVSALKYTE